jgi:hypothetical protein
MKKILLAVVAILGLVIAALLLFLKTDASNPYEQVTWGKFSAECATDDLPSNRHGKDFHACDYSVPESEIPTFKEIDLPWANVFDNTKSLPLMASAMIDVDNDGVDEVFIGGGVTQNDALFRYSTDGFTDVSAALKLPAKPANTTTFGATSFDLDGNGFSDLILTGDYGILWYKNDGSGFTAEPISVSLNDKSVAATTTIADYNGDGYADIFLSAYVRLDKMEGQTIFKDANYGASSLLLKNNGDNTFSDVTKAAGLEYIHNTFQGVFVDIDNDQLLDLVVAYDTGEARTYKNVDGNTFKMMPNPLTGKFAYPMGIAVGDYNNDGLVDFFFSNTGSSVPSFLARGDLAEDDVYVSDWILFKNEGNFKFTDAATATKIADFEFSWGAIFEDFNLDGRQDLVVAENYVDFPPHQLFKLPGRFLLQRNNGTFAAVEDQAGVVNKNYAITPLSSDFNQDGYPDMVYANLNGETRAFINQGTGHNYLSVRFPETAAYAGTRVQLSFDDGKVMSENYVIGEGLASDQTSTLTFGLGTANGVAKMTIAYPNGKTVEVTNPGINQVHQLRDANKINPDF